MTSTLNSIISQLILLPTSLILLMIIGCLLMASRFRRAGLTLVLLGIVALSVLSMPITAHKMIRTLEHQDPVDPHELGKVKAIVVLGGAIRHEQPEYASDVSSSTTLERLRYAAFLQNTYDLPILVTGGTPSSGEPEGYVMQRDLETVFRVPVRWTETESNNTAENARLSREVLQKEGVDTIALVTHAWHMPRAKKAFENSGFTVVAAPTIFHMKPVKGIMNFIPQASYLHLANIALHEWVGMVWYGIHD
ncbi:YdcF family protein [Candidimonas sp. SYP-B2681]|uniref:YdcF family protein n=1 Tax=Candidimonas sp. SYP-B2681 TaxID=2497686 RepID=UPI000F87597C|nr:YdcF family protein [Candidimonas sp. SYP-B2681]RTZ43194.1 YdcF family protein [Candidimonas sp. SYP-B2681]